jgi:hypothetical protein
LRYQPTPPMNEASLSSVAFQAFGTVTRVQPAVDAWRCQRSRSPTPRGSRRISQGPSIRKRPEGPVRYSVRSLGVETTDWAAAGGAAARRPTARASRLSMFGGRVSTSSRGRWAG